MHKLFDNIANGPLFGGNDFSADSEIDAMSQIKSLQAGSDKEILEGITFVDIKQMISDLTAPPAEIGHEIPSTDGDEQSNTPFGARFTNMPSSDQQPPLAAASPAGEMQQEEKGVEAYLPVPESRNGSTALPGLNFMQASELGHAGLRSHGQDELISGHVSVQNDAPDHQKALETVSRAATPGFGSGTPIVEKSETNATTTVENGWNTPQLNTQSLPAAPSGWGDVRIGSFSNMKSHSVALVLTT